MAWSPPFDGEWHDAGGGHHYLFLQGDAEDYADPPAVLAATLTESDEEPGHRMLIVGIIDSHKRADGSDCAGGVAFLTDDGRPTWKVNNLDPLDLEPSVLCNPAKGGCGSHGWYRQGRWVEA